MKKIDAHSNVLIISSLLACSFILSGCGSTPDYVVEPECRAESTENCTGNEEDRGYDPCLVNKNLPVCKD